MASRSPSAPGRVTPARVYAVTRIALGGWILVAPAAFGGKWFAPPQDPLLTASIMRSVGGRDLGIGAGLLLTGKPRPWLWLCASCDILDAGMVLAARSKFPRRDVATSVGGAFSYALAAIAIATTGTPSHRRHDARDRNRWRRPSHVRPARRTSHGTPER